MVYFIEGVGTGLVKIGWTIDVAARWADLSTMSPAPLNLLAVMPGGRTKEQELHGLLAEYRHHGEWFIRCRALNSVIAKAALPDALADLTKNRDRYLGAVLREVIQARKIEALKHNWVRMGRFQKCSACGRVSFIGAKMRKSTCPGTYGRRRTRKATGALLGNQTA